jgi:hypothetical protein
MEVTMENRRLQAMVLVLTRMTGVWKLDTSQADEFVIRNAAGEEVFSDVIICDDITPVVFGDPIDERYTPKIIQLMNRHNLVGSNFSIVYTDESSLVIDGKRFYITYGEFARMYLPVEIGEQLAEYLMSQI